MIRALLLIVLLLPLPALAQSPSRADIAAQQAGGLFVASCVQHAGDPAALRAWAARIGLPAVPEPALAGFLKGAAGQVYDASNPAGKYVLVSHDDGGCLVLAESVNTAELIHATEAALANIPIAAVLDGDRGDLGDTGMRHRTYHAAQAGRGWTLVISYGPRQPDQAMLFAAAR